MFHIRTRDQLLSHLADKGDLSVTTLEQLELDADAVPSLAEAILLKCRFLRGCRMPKDLSAATFIDCAMPALNFDSATLFGARFLRCDLSFSVFDRCDLSAASFLDCRWDGVVLKDCDLDAALLPAH
jgi:uncharacterized protein YjbI with pentapeptide repeats